MNINHYTYRVSWSLEHGEFIGLCAKFPSLSWRDRSVDKALAGIRGLVAGVVEDMAASGETIVPSTPLPESANPTFIYDYNGDGEWSPSAVVRRYEEYSRQFKVASARTLEPQIYIEGSIQWVGPIMHQVVQGIKEDDPACVELGIDFICESRGFPFGMKLKSKTARALYSATMTDRQLDRVRSRVAQMLMDGYVPQEIRFYCRLFRRTGLGPYRSALLALTPGQNGRMIKHLAYVRLLSMELEN